MKFNLDSNYQEILDTFRLKQSEFEKIITAPLLTYINDPQTGELHKQIDIGDLFYIVKDICNDFNIFRTTKIVYILCQVDELIINEV